MSSSITTIASVAWAVAGVVVTRTCAKRSPIVARRAGRLLAGSRINSGIEFVQQRRLMRSPCGFRVGGASSISSGIGIVVGGVRMGVVTMVLPAEHID